MIVAISPSPSYRLSTSEYLDEMTPIAEGSVEYSSNSMWLARELRNWLDERGMESTYDNFGNLQVAFEDDHEAILFRLTFPG